MHYRFLLLLLLLFNYTIAQKKEKTFDSVYFKTATITTANDPNEAIRIADSLYTASKEPMLKVKSLMLKANVYQSKGNIKKSIATAMDAEVLAERSNLVEWQARILGFLSTQYRNLGLVKNGRTLLDKGISICKSFPDREKSNQYLGLSLQEMAYYYHDEDKHLDAVKSLQKADTLFQSLKISNEKYFFLAANEEFLGREFQSLKSYLKSFVHFKRATGYLKLAGAEQSELSGFIFNGMGAAFQGMKKKDSALICLSKALVIAQQSGHPNLTPDVYGNLAKYYFEEGDVKKASRYSHMKDSIDSAKAKRNSSISDDIVEELSKKSSFDFSFWFWVGLIAILFVMALVIYNVKKRRIRQTERSNIEPSEEIIKEFQKLQIIEENLIEQSPKQMTARQEIVSAETEDRILRQLAKFEKKQKFTSKNMTLTMLSARIETNSKYLSLVINKNKGCDFNSYINGLRIQYAINKIETDPSYLNYKLSYLAEECGFSSHSKFSALFKNVTGMSPSDYISSRSSDDVIL